MNSQVLQEKIWKQFLHRYLAGIWLLVLLSLFGCAHTAQVTEDNEIASHANIRPIDLDASTAEKIGQEALQKIGYDEIIKLAEKAGFVAYKADVSIHLISYGSIGPTGFLPVFSRYAAVAGVTSQADSPLPGPADIAAVGVIVLGLVDAGLLDGYLLNTVGAWIAGTNGKPLMAKAKTNEAEGAGVTTAPAESASAGGNTTAESTGTANATGAEAEVPTAGGEANIVGESTVGAAAAKVLQTGGNKINESTARGLNDALGMNLPRREWGRALEKLKKLNDLPNNHHGRILSSGDYVNDAGHYLGNLLEYL